MRVTSPVPHKRVRIEIIPLIDIMFFLLASFTMVSLSQTHKRLFGSICRLQLHLHQAR
jgi:biopolymer transport protein ExbD